jgi:hypothetical protein
MSHVDRLNLGVRTESRRWTRLTLAFGKRFAETEAALAIFAWHHNWCKKHASHKGLTPTQAAGIADRRMTVDDLVAMIVAREDAEIPAGKLKRGSYRSFNLSRPI